MNVRSSNVMKQTTTKYASDSKHDDNTCACVSIVQSVEIGRKTELELENKTTKSTQLNQKWALHSKR